MNYKDANCESGKVLSCFKIYISEALKGMEKVAEHINEMQRIHEEYGAIFDHLFRQHQKSCKQVNARQPVDISLANFCRNHIPVYARCSKPNGFLWIMFVLSITASVTFL